MVEVAKERGKALAQVLCCCTNFAETESLTTVGISVVERYLEKVWDGACSNNTADIFGCTNEIYQCMCQQMMKICW